MKHIEDSLQMSCIRWFDMQYSAFSVLLFHPANGGKRNAIEAAKFKKMGVRAGVCDLFLAIPNGKYHGLFIELKSPKGTLTDNQKNFIAEVQNSGYAVKIVRSLDEFINVITNYFKGEI